MPQNAVDAEYDFASRVWAWLAKIQSRHSRRIGLSLKALRFVPKCNACNFLAQSNDAYFP